mmetsp:Transcript_19487/g.45544  ORF Transcript_19487/g.45544 Transcript_19487/m.45544 type:complete len:91 (+) Transcript_19487:386-658(+)
MQHAASDFLLHDHGPSLIFGCLLKKERESQKLNVVKCRTCVHEQPQACFDTSTATMDKAPPYTTAAVLKEESASITHHRTRDVFQAHEPE